MVVLGGLGIRMSAVGVGIDSLNQGLFGLVEKIQDDYSEKEFHWLSENMIRPELPQIVETLEMVKNLLLFNTPEHPDSSKLSEKGPAIKLPVSSLKLENLKGILVRDGECIVSMMIQLHEKSFNKVINKLSLKNPIVLPQIITASDAIDSSIDMINQSYKFNDQDNHNETHNHQSLIKLFQDLLTQLSIAKNCLQIPTDPKLIFPEHIALAINFEPQLPDNISIDLYINQAEICIDMKYLHKVLEKPWLDIDKQTGKSYVDNIREEMKLQDPFSSISPLNPQDLQSRFQSISKDNGIFTNMLNIIKHKYEPMDYITKCITYNGMVVMVNKKIEVSSPDPVLLSAFTKLDSVEYLVSRFLDNLKQIGD